MLDWVRIFIAGCLYYSGLLKLARWWAMRTGRYLVILYECMLWGYEISPTEEGFQVPRPPAKAEAAFVRYPVWVEDPTLALRLAARHATLGTWFTSVLEEANAPVCSDYEMGSCPRAEMAARHLINLPTLLRVNTQDVESIVSAVKHAETMARGRAHGNLLLE